MNYFTITTEMTQDLNLKGNELLIYAVIKSHCAGFYGTRSLLASLIGCSSLKTINNCLDNLIDKGLIKKESKIANNQIRNCYFATATIQDLNLENIKEFITQDLSITTKRLFIKELILANFTCLVLRVYKTGRELFDSKKDDINIQVQYWNMQHNTHYTFKLEFIELESKEA